MAVDLKSLIVQGKGLKDTLQYVPAEYNVIRTYSVYEFRNQDDYYPYSEPTSIEAYPFEVAIKIKNTSEGSF